MDRHDITLDVVALAVLVIVLVPLSIAGFFIMFGLVLVGTPIYLAITRLTSQED